jgi:hypothetical protein
MLSETVERFETTFLTRTGSHDPSLDWAAADVYRYGLPAESAPRLGSDSRSIELSAMMHCQWGRHAQCGRPRVRLGAGGPAAGRRGRLPAQSRRHGVCQ